jgi:hypothetical protein
MSTVTDGVPGVYTQSVWMPPVSGRQSTDSSHVGGGGPLPARTPALSEKRPAIAAAAIASGSSERKIRRPDVRDMRDLRSKRAGNRV